MDQDLYRGSNLDSKLIPLGLERIAAEDDFSFRKRAFLAIYESNPSTALEVLYGNDLADWDHHEKCRAQDLATSKPGKAEIERFIQNLTGDPMATRQRRQAITLSYQ